MVLFSLRIARTFSVMNNSFNMTNVILPLEKVKQYKRTAEAVLITYSANSISTLSRLNESVVVVSK